MKILYFYQYFSTPQGAWGTRVYEFAKEWVEQGHEVTVITSVYSKSDLKATKFIEDQYIDGIHVKIINIKIDNKQNFLKRIWSFILYSILSSYYSIVLPADIVIASSGPITVGLPGLISHYFRKRKLVFEVRDLWPEGAIELGMLKNKILKRIAYSFEKLCYKSSSFIVTLSPGMTNNIKSRFKIVNIDDVTNAANIKLFYEKKPFNDRSLVPKSYAIYTGNIGEVNNSYLLFNTATILKAKGRDDIKILLIGDGQQREELVELSIKNEISNFIRYDLISKNELVSYIQNSFVSLVPLKGSPVLDTSSPNKFFESLSAGIPVIQTTNGWMKYFLKDHNVGFTVNPNDPEELANLLIFLHDNPKVTNDMGLNAYDVAKDNFDKGFLANKMLKILTGVYNDSYLRE